MDIVLVVTAVDTNVKSSSIISIIIIKKKQNQINSYVYCVISEA